MSQHVLNNEILKAIKVWTGNCFHIITISLVFQFVLQIQSQTMITRAMRAIFCDIGRLIVFSISQTDDTFEQDS
jgi:hypothetical protein